MGPSGVDDQSNDLIRAAISPGLPRKPDAGKLDVTLSRNGSSPRRNPLGLLTPGLLTHGRAKSLNPGAMQPREDFARQAPPGPEWSSHVPGN
jgi:hypothetical protein